MLQRTGALFRLFSQIGFVFAANPTFFFAEFDLNHDLIARFLYSLLPASGKKVLLIDRTNWKFGQTDINIFMLAIAHEGVAYPLAVRC